MADEDKKKVVFLCEAAQVYTDVCPQMAAHLMSRVLVSLSSDHLPLTTCLHCSTLLTPHTASQHTLSSGALRKKRRSGKFKGHLVHQENHTTQHYMVIRCKMCGWSIAAGIAPKSYLLNTPHNTPRHTPHNTPRHTPHNTPRHTPHNTPCHTPHNTSRHTSHTVTTCTRRRSLTLKALLREEDEVKTKSSKLADFLSRV